MTNSPRPTLGDVTRALNHLADRVLTHHRSAGLEAYVVHTLKLILTELEFLIPGLDPVPNAEAAQAYSEASEGSLREGGEREALSYALRGIACSPHNPVLWYRAGQAAVELGSLEMALRMMWHALWIHPGYLEARRDLDALTSFFDSRQELPPDDELGGEQANDEK